MATHLRPKLDVGPVDDPAEREADRVADRVVGTPDTVIQRKCASCSEGGASCPECEEDEPQVQRQARPGSGPVSAPDPLRSQLGPGRELESSVRTFFEPRLHADLGGVRVHTGAEADDAASALNARAFALGRDVAFARGEYAPGTGPGRRLIAHELVHVVQSGSVGERGDAGGVPVRRSVVDSEVEPGLESPGSRDGPGPIHGGELPFEPPTGPAPAPEPEECPPPEEMECPSAADTPSPVAHTFLFPVNSATLNGAQIAEIDAAAAAWHTAGRGGEVRVDGYASAEGVCEHNWGLSCRRAQAVAAELASPSDGSPGVPGGSISRLAHGESNAFGTGLAPNRRATISVPQPAPVPTPTPTPNPPAPPTCAFPFSLGSGRGCGGGPDFTHFDFPSISTASEAKLALWAAARNALHLPFRSAVSTTDCMLEMDAVLVGLAGVAGHAAFLRFAAGTGGTVTHGLFSILGLLARISPSFRATVRTVQTDIETQLAGQASSGTLDPCALSVTPPQTHFGFLDGPPLKAVIGGTQGEEIFATSFSGSASARTYTMGLEFVICDDFGVDETDLYAPGLFPFWVLQHERSPSLFAPFINELRLPVTISGTF